MSKTIAIANQKGGVGKTTTAVNLGACLAALHYRTLIIDLDPQGNATSGVGVDRSTLDRSIYDVLAGELSLDDAVLATQVELLDLVPARTELAAAEVELVHVEERREFVLADVLGTQTRRWDFVLIDCPPSLGLLTINALTAADSVLIPVQAEYYALEGLARLLETIERVRTHTNARLQLEGMVLTMHDNRNNLSRQVEDEVRAHFAAQTYETVIPRNVRLSEAPSFGAPIILYDVTSRGARSYLDLAREFVERNSGHGAPAPA